MLHSNVFLRCARIATVACLVALMTFQTALAGRRRQKCRQSCPPPSCCSPCHAVAVSDCSPCDDHAVVGDSKVGELKVGESQSEKPSVLGSRSEDELALPRESPPLPPDAPARADDPAPAPDPGLAPAPADEPPALPGPPGDEPPPARPTPAPVDDPAEPAPGTEPAPAEPAPEEPAPANPAPAEPAPANPAPAEEPDPFGLPADADPADADPADADPADAAPAEEPDPFGLPPADDAAPAEPAPEEPAPEEPAPAEAAEEDPFGAADGGASNEPPMRLWTDVTGKHQVTARLFERLDGKVRLFKANGRFTTVPLWRLSASDREYLIANDVTRVARR